MESILRRLFQGEIAPYKRTVPETEENKPYYQAFESHVEKFLQAMEPLPPEFEQMFTELMDDLVLVRGIESEDMFYHGFSLGAKLVAEGLCRDD